MITAQTVARFFLAFANECGELMTNLKLNKLVYYTQAWHLALLDRPLFEEQIEAWVHGPVIPELYGEYKRYGYHPILEDNLDLESMRQQFNVAQQDLLGDIIEVYFPKSAYELEQLTHDEDPWILARNGLKPDVASHNVIEHGVMKRFYAQMKKGEE